MNRRRGIRRCCAGSEERCFAALIQRLRNQSSAICRELKLDQLQMHVHGIPCQDGIQRGHARCVGIQSGCQMQRISGTQAAIGLQHQHGGMVEGSGIDGQQLQIVRAQTLELLPCALSLDSGDLVGTLLDSQGTCKFRHTPHRRNKLIAAAAIPLRHLRALWLFGSLVHSATRTLVSTEIISSARCCATPPSLTRQGAFPGAQRPVREQKLYDPIVAWRKQSPPSTVRLACN